MVGGPVIKKKISRRMKRNVIIGVTGLVVITSILFVVMNFTSGDDSTGVSANTDTRELNEQARPFANEIANYFGVFSNQLSEYANNASTKSLFLSGSDEQLIQEAENVSSQFTSALKVRLLRPGQHQVDTASNPPLSFGSLAMLNRVERSTGPVAAEALLFSTENQHIVFVERVKNQGDQLIGIVHLSLSVSLFQQALDDLYIEDGYLEIQQSSTGSPLVLGSTGNSSLQAGTPGSVSIAGTRWTIAYWPPSLSVGNQIVSAGTGLSPFVFVVAGLLVLCVIGALFYLKRNQPVAAPGNSSADTNYQGAIKAIMEGAHPGMEKLIKHFPGAIKSSGEKAEISKALVGDDITSIASMDSIEDQADSSDVFDITQPKDDLPDKQEKLDATQDNQQEKSPSTSSSPGDIPKVIFRKYDIRGKVENELTAEVVKKIGMAIGSQANDMDEKTIIVGRDGRHSSPELAKNLIEGLTSTGRDIIDVGIVPTPVLYFATHHFNTGNGVMVTGSHNGPEYNGLKIVLGGNTLSEEKILALKDRISASNFSSGNGNVKSEEILAEYLRRIGEDIPVAFGNSFKLVVDCGNGAASVAASQLYKAMGYDVVELYCELDGNFPNHHPDPSQPENLKDLIDKVKETGADLGFAFDGDGDRLGVVDANGNILWPDRQMMVFARDVLSRNQGAEIIFDVKCSKHLKTVIESNGGKPLMWNTGHSLIKSKMKEVGSPLAGEMSGHIFFGERWYGFDDALYSGARMLEILTNAKADPAEFFAELPSGISTPELKIDLSEAEHEKFMSDLEAKISFEEAEIISIDGFRVEFADGWGLIRPSNTTPCLVARFEADSQEALERIQGQFKDLIKSINPGLSVPF